MFKHVNVGDTVCRLLAEAVKMNLRVTKVTGERIVCGSWEFDRNTGGEIDEFLGWDGVARTGSRLVAHG